MEFYKPVKQVVNGTVILPPFILISFSTLVASYVWQRMFLHLIFCAKIDFFNSVIFAKSTQIRQLKILFNYPKKTTISNQHFCVHHLSGKEATVTER
jgi:hypothetical protein